MELYVLEGFLARLSISPLREQFVLKGGVLLAAFGNRRPTRDVDLSASQTSNDAANVLGLIREILSVELGVDDGLVFEFDSLAAEVIRDEDQYSGVRVSARATLDRARLSFHIDVNVGDPIYPEPTTVDVPRLLDGDPIRLRGYPMHMVLAEKIVTAIQRGTVNTRWRDFGDIWTLTRHHEVDGGALQEAISVVAHHRSAQLAPLIEALDGYADIGQTKWANWRRKGNNLSLPEQFGEVVMAITAFGDPVLDGQVSGRKWDPNVSQWIRD